jgi:hypothetical protein
MNPYRIRQLKADVGAFGHVRLIPRGDLLCIWKNGMTSWESWSLGVLESEDKKIRGAFEQSVQMLPGRLFNGSGLRDSETPRLSYGCPSQSPEIGTSVSVP